MVKLLPGTYMRLAARRRSAVKWKKRRAAKRTAYKQNAIIDVAVSLGLIVAGIYGADKGGWILICVGMLLLALTGTEKHPRSEEEIEKDSPEADAAAMTENREE